jgi:uncharacterized RDD family membrane protein YckC
MTREVLIDTPENVTLEYEFAGIGTRFVANLIDTLLEAVTIVCVALVAVILDLLLLSVAAHWHWSLLTKILNEAAEFVVALTIILTSVVTFGYYILFEYLWSGQTPGKRTTGIRVIREGGYPVDLYCVILRTVLRIIDFMPLLYCVGMASMLATRRYQRVGDVLAGTMVVKQRAPTSLINLLHATRLRPENLDPAALALIRADADKMTAAEYEAVRHFTERFRSILNPHVRYEAARVIAQPLMERLQIDPPESAVSIDYPRVLEYLAVAYETSRRPVPMIGARSGTQSRPIEEKSVNP